MSAAELKGPDLTTPRKRLPSGRTRHNAERWSWIFMRASGVLLLVLIFTHLYVNLMVGGGVNRIDFAFVAGKWADPIWKVWDAAMLWLGMLHGFNGMRLLINDYARSKRAKAIWHALLGIATIAIIILGTLVITTFDPCPAGTDPEYLNVPLCQELGRL